MIKRLGFLTGRPDTDRGTIEEACRQRVVGALAAPVEVRAARAVISTHLRDPGGPARHDVVSEEWFDDADHRRRFEDWLSGPLGAPLVGALGRVTVSDGSPVGSPVVWADEVVMRGDDWLARRWVDGGPRFKHMALAVRAAGLTPATFSERWRDHAGRARTGDSASSAIPEDVRGLAYVQNHPLRTSDADRAHDAVNPVYDAVNEVYFDDLDGLRRRVGWFHDNRVGNAADDLFGATWFLAVREQVITTTR